jgi:Predicted pyridoxal phosphate-dependent enzyme apparently involved in regulation of cell wall biogenesis
MKPFDIEKKLSLLHEQEYILLTGNATAGIYLTLKAMGLENKKIAIPNNVCMNVPIAVKLSNNSLKYLDISKDTLGLSVESLKKNVKEIDVVIAVHSYGSTCEIENIKKFCKNDDILLIEDFAVAQGAKINNKPVGSFGDVSVVSFGAGKIIDCGHGGAILTNNKELFLEIVKVEEQLKIATKKDREKISQLGLLYKQLYNTHYGTDIDNYIPVFQRKVEDTQ